MSDLTAVDILIQPDTATIERAREVNRRMPLSIPAGITLDDTHLPHITMLQRYLNTADLERAYAAITAVVANTDTAALSYHVPGIAYSEDWGPPGQAVAVLEVRPGPQVLDLQAALLAAVRPFTGSGGTDAAFVTDPGQQINPKTKDWVETFEPNQIGANYTAHLTVGFATVTDLKALQTQPFDEFDVQPVGLAVYHLGNNGTARSRLKNGPLTPETNSDHRSELACGQGHLGGFEVVSSVSDLSSFWGCRRRCQRRGESGDASSVNDPSGSFCGCLGDRQLVSCRVWSLCLRVTFTPLMHESCILRDTILGLKLLFRGREFCCRGTFRQRGSLVRGLSAGSDNRRYQ